MGFDPSPHPRMPKPPRTNSCFRLPYVHTGCTKGTRSHVSSRGPDRKRDTGSHLQGPYTCMSIGSCQVVLEEGGGQTLIARKQTEEFRGIFIAHHLRGKTKTKAVSFFFFCWMSQRQLNLGNSSPNVWPERPHTPFRQKREKKEPSLAEWKGCWEKRKKRGTGDQCLYVLQQHPSGWHYAWLTCSIDQLKKREKKQTFSRQRTPFKSARALAQLYS